MASSPSTSYSLSPPPPPSPLFSPIPEYDMVEEDDDSSMPYKHQPTPLHSTAATTTTTTKSSASRKPARPHNVVGDDEKDFSVSCNKCRPSSRDKISVVPLSANGHRNFSPNVIRSLFLSLTRRTPRTSSADSSSSNATAGEADEWKLAATELSRKLLHATRKRDEALLEASRLKYSVSELERKLARIEASLHRPPPPAAGSLQVDAFLRAVTDARSAVRHLSRSHAAQIRQGAAGPRAMDRLSSLLHPYDVLNARPGQSQSQSMLYALEALLNRVFYGEFEAEEATAPPDPAARCAASMVELEEVRGVGWEEVLSKGTRHYSEGLSRFCDRRMSEVVGTLGWARAWPEALLQAFFVAAKAAWVVHLLARTTHPPVPILRVEARARFDDGYMEDVAAVPDRARRHIPTTVRMMVMPGFYVYSNSSCGVVKCKVLCLYNSNNGGRSSNSKSCSIKRENSSVDTRHQNTTVDDIISRKSCDGKES